MAFCFCFTISYILLKRPRISWKFLPHFESGFIYWYSILWVIRTMFHQHIPDLDLWLLHSSLANHLCIWTMIFLLTFQFKKYLMLYIYTVITKLLLEKIKIEKNKNYFSQVLHKQHNKKNSIYETRIYRKIMKTVVSNYVVLLPKGEISNILRKNDNMI